jgi:sugar phosphate isomerase/epimerase
MRLFPGEGIIDLKGILGALKKIGYEDGITPEVLGPAPDSWTPEEASKAALDSTRAVLKQAGITA